MENPEKPKYVFLRNPVLAEVDKLSDEELTLWYEHFMKYLSIEKRELTKSLRKASFNELLDGRLAELERQLEENKTAMSEVSEYYFSRIKRS